MLLLAPFCSQVRGSWLIKVLRIHDCCILSPKLEMYHPHTPWKLMENHGRGSRKTVGWNAISRTWLFHSQTHSSYDYLHKTCKEWACQHSIMDERGTHKALWGGDGFQGIRSFLQRCVTDKLPMIQNQEGVSSVILNQFYFAHLLQQLQAGMLQNVLKCAQGPVRTFYRELLSFKC